MIEWALDRLPAAVTKVIVAVNWQAEALEAHFQRSERDLSFQVVRESEPLGTGGAVKNCAAHIESDRFFVLNADIWSDMDLDEMLRVHDAQAATATISLKEVPEEQVTQFGVARLDPEAPQRIVEFVEKPARPEDAPSRMVNAGAYLLNRSVLSLIPSGRLVSLEKEIFPHLLDRGMCGVSFEGHWVDVGDAERIRVVARATGTWHGEDAQIEGTVDDSVLGDRVRVEAGAHVVRCVIGDDVRIAAGATVEDCIIGDGENVSGDRRDERIWSRPVPVGYPESQVGNALAGPKTESVS